MITILGAALALQLTPSDPAVELCKPALARKAGEDIATIDVVSSVANGRRRRIEGRLTAFAQMGPAPPGMARTHHLGRLEFTFRCDIRDGRVRKTRVNPLRE